MDYLNFFITSFTTIFVIVDPPGNIPTFLSITESFGPRIRDTISKKSTIIGCTILLAFALSGNFLLNFFKISIDGLRIAGGLLLFAISVDILMGSRRKEVYAERKIESSDIDSIAVFPIALPLYTGPGAITATIVLSNEATNLQMKTIVILSILVVYAIVRLTHVYSNFIIRILGSSGSNIIARLMAIFLAAIAIEFIFTGLEGKISLILKNHSL
ncbi:MAG TPA: NAAT family transporter [Archaeoglobaceae archaeon]|nr:NAAT family transporter [Archaeoglobaceae archaeon]